MIKPDDSANSSRAFHRFASHLHFRTPLAFLVMFAGHTFELLTAHGTCLHALLLLPLLVVIFLAVLTTPFGAIWFTIRERSFLSDYHRGTHRTMSMTIVMVLGAVERSLSWSMVIVMLLGVVARSLSLTMVTIVRLFR